MWVDSGKGKGIWKERINETTGESSIKEHTPKVVWKSCKAGSHSYKLSGNREITCDKCGLMSAFVPGRDNELLKRYKIN
ncbi:MAG: hypothetical protein K0U38_01485 [Epsilonproteobacteria bacterium]|nr:hypothetical protein [Campylobacterota bacterium]